MRIRILLALVVSGIGSLAVGGLVSAAPVTGFNPGRIIDDLVFENRSSMSLSQIQRFLNSKVPTCDTWGTQPSEFGGGTRAQYAATKGVKPPFTCLKDYRQNNKPAAQIIYEAAQDYHINPQVLIVLLQKEQGLITDDWPWPFQYKSATGYACPDSSGCDSKYFGLTNQVRWAAKMYRSILNQSPTWYTPYILGDNQIYWNPDTGRCGSSTVNIQNLSTVALYSYTPYRPNQAALNAGWGTGDSCSSYGNRNFYLYFTNWFGSVRTSIPYASQLVSLQTYYDAAMTDPITSELINMTPGMKIYVRILIRNMGYQTWDQSFMRLGTFAPQDHTSIFADGSWLSPARAAQMTESSVTPGMVGTFTFSMTAPSTPNEYVEQVSPLAEGRTWFGQPLLYSMNVATATAPANTDNTLTSGEQVRVNETRLSHSLHDVLTLQRDGNLVFYSNFSPRWNTATVSQAADRLVMQSDGNLVLYSSSNSVLWESHTSGNPGAHLDLQNDGNLVLYNSSNVALWNTGTVVKPNGLSYVNQRLYTGILFKGQKLETPNRRYHLALQADGNLVVYSPSNRALWASGTSGKPVSHLFLQSDGNLVLYGTSGNVLWHTRTMGTGPSKLIMQSDGNLVLYNSLGRTPWNTHTSGQP